MEGSLPYRLDHGLEHQRVRSSTFTWTPFRQKARVLAIVLVLPYVLGHLKIPFSFGS